MMLDQLRRHATSWVVKTTLTLIILTFIFFFGYTQLTSGIRDSQNYVAFVGKTGIPRRKYNEAVDASLEKMREGLKEGVPPEMESFLRQSVLSQLVSRELIAQFAAHLGLSVSDEEIARSIREDRQLFPEGNPDLSRYQEQFLPYYLKRYGEDFEKAVARDLLVEKTSLLLALLFDPWQKEFEGKPEIASEELIQPWLDDFKEEVGVEYFGGNP